MAGEHWYCLQRCTLQCINDCPQPGPRVLDAVRKSDGEMVMLKQISRSVHPNEIPIGQYLSSPPLASDPRNHCCPVLDVLQDPTNADSQILVMPLLKEFNNPPQLTIGEAVDFFRQAFEVRQHLLFRSYLLTVCQGLQYIHEHHIAHRYVCSVLGACVARLMQLQFSDCMRLNIMIDPRDMFPDMFHPVARHYDRNFVGPAKWRSRTMCPSRYYWTDFGLSCRYDANDIHPLEVPIIGGDRSVPEYLENEMTPRNPFHTDVYMLGNLVREDFLQVRRCAVSSMPSHQLLLIAHRSTRT